MCLPEAAESGIKFLNYIRDFQRVLDGRKFANMPAISNFLQKLRTDYNQEVRNPENPGEESRKKTKRNTFEENNNILDGYWSGRNVEVSCVALLTISLLIAFTKCRLCLGYQKATGQDKEMDERNIVT